MTDCLFVYGSLLRAIGHPMGERLRREATLAGTATVAGTLFRISWYPAITLGGDGRVHGEIYRLANPAKTLAWLDEYEGITPGPTGVAESDEYERKVVITMRDDGSTIRAWIYAYRRPLEARQVVGSGRWTG